MTSQEYDSLRAIYRSIGAYATLRNLAVLLAEDGEGKLARVVADLAIDFNNRPAPRPNLHGPSPWVK